MTFDVKFSIMWRAAAAATFPDQVTSKVITKLKKVLCLFKVQRPFKIKKKSCGQMTSHNKSFDYTILLYLYHYTVAVVRPSL
jgi:hypothetical protein